MEFFRSVIAPTLTEMQSCSSSFLVPDHISDICHLPKVKTPKGHGIGRRRASERMNSGASLGVVCCVFRVGEGLLLRVCSRSARVQLLFYVGSAIVQG